MLTKTFARLVLLANIIAWPIAYWAISSWLNLYAFRTELQWWFFFFAGLLSLIIAVITISFQAIRASLINPAEALKYE